eukprot:m.9810 g.9810  ORF g.9810 m.9810 type:complete len:162 (-) comp7948_c0_seq1:457-942(-)
MERLDIMCCQAQLRAIDCNQLSQQIQKLTLKLKNGLSQAEATDAIEKTFLFNSTSNVNPVAKHTNKSASISTSTPSQPEPCAQTTAHPPTVNKPCQGVTTSSLRIHATTTPPSSRRLIADETIKRRKVNDQPAATATPRRRTSPRRRLPSIPARGVSITAV